MVNLQDQYTKMNKEGSLYYMKTLFVIMYWNVHYLFIYLLKYNLLKLIMKIVIIVILLCNNYSIRKVSGTEFI
jgi:hypothetical protein